MEGYISPSALYFIHLLSRLFYLITCDIHPVLRDAVPPGNKWMSTVVENSFFERRILEKTDSNVAGIYGLLAIFFAREIDLKQLEMLRNPEFRNLLETLGVNLGEDFFKRDATLLLEDLAVEFATLFIGPGNFISPHESVHRPRDDGDYGNLWGADTVAVKKFIEATGLAYRPEFGGMPDHIAAEFEFVQKIEERMETARSDGDQDLAENLKSIKNRFLTEHLLAWGPGLMDKIMANATLPFYREIAALAKNFLQQEGELIQQQAVK